MIRLALLLVAFLPCAALAENAERHIIVSATGWAEAAPDMATVSLGVSREASTASEAMAAMAEAAQVVLEEVANLGVDARDVQTTSINLNPVWDAGNVRPRQIRGYSASTMVTVRVRALDRLGGLLDAVVGGGANQLNGLSFGIADMVPFEAAARADAVGRARQKAETLAEAAGVTLGPVQMIAEGGGGLAPAPMMRGAMLEAAAVPIASGELDIRVTVQVTFSIAE